MLGILDDSNALPHLRTPEAMDLYIADLDRRVAAARAYRAGTLDE